MEPEIVIKGFSDDKCVVFYNIFVGNCLESVGELILQFSKDGSSIYLAEIFINQEYRKLGIGTKVISWLINFSKKFGISRIRLFVDFTNEHAQHIYRKLGFEFLNSISSYCYDMELNLDGIN